MKTYDQHLKTKVKLFVGYFQISSLLHGSYQVPYPYTYLNFMGKIEMFSVDVAKATPGPCIFGPSYTFASKVYTIGFITFAVYLFSAAVLKGSQHEKPWAQKALPWLSTALFLLYPSFSVEFFDVLKCRTIDSIPYVIADLSIECVTGSSYTMLRAFAIFWVLFWACGLPLITLALLWPVRSELRQLHKDDQLPGFQQHLKDFYTPYRPAAWFFEVVEYAKKLLLIGIIPVFSGNVVGAVIAMLVVNVHVALLLKMEPFANRLDNFLAVCLNALLFIVILISVLLKMDAAGQTGDGFNTDTAAVLLVACNVLVVVMSATAYWISMRQSCSYDAELAGDIQGMENLTTVRPRLDWDEEAEDLAPYRRLPDAVSKTLRTSQTTTYVAGSQAELTDSDVNGWWVREVLPDDGVSGPGFIIVTLAPDGDYVDHV
jgi:hypothetical protein